MKKRFTLFLLGTSLLHLKAENNRYEQYYYDMPFDYKEVIQPQFPDNTLSLTQFGAISDGIFLNTDAFSSAIDSLSSLGGGTLVIPRGIWLTGPIRFKSNINLHLQEGSLIMFSTDFQLYTRYSYTLNGNIEYDGPISPISGFELENIAITGNGIIDGNGEAWRPRKKIKFNNHEWNEIIKNGGVLNNSKDMWFPDKYALEAHEGLVDWSSLSEEQYSLYTVYHRPRMVTLFNCKNILLEGVTFQNAPNWNVNPICCENLTVDNVTIRSAWNAQNSDAIDIESCNNVIVVNSKFDVGDDAICIKSGYNEAGRRRGIPSQNIIIDNCTVYHGHGGFVIGSEMSGSVRNIIARNMTFIGTDVGLRFKSRRGRGGVVENIYINNVNMTNIKRQSIIYELFYGKADTNQPTPAVSEETPEFKNFYINNIISINAGSAILVTGLPEMPVKNINFNNVFINARNGIDLRNAVNFNFTNCVFDIDSDIKKNISDCNNINTESILFK